MPGVPLDFVDFPALEAGACRGRKPRMAGRRCEVRTIFCLSIKMDTMDDLSTTAPAWRACAVSTTLEVVGGRWKAVILFYLLGGTRRFSEIQRYLPGVTQRVLTMQLRELEADGVLERVVHPEVPPRVEYTLTAFGRSLQPVLLSLRDWGERHRNEVAALVEQRAQPA